MFRCGGAYSKVAGAPSSRDPGTLPAKCLTGPDPTEVSSRRWPDPIGPTYRVRCDQEARISRATQRCASPLSLPARTR